MGRVRTGVGVISIECPVRLKLGELFDFDEMRRVAALARDRGIRLHLDGARLYVASAYAGIRVSEYAALFDTVYVSLWKCFNAPFGAVLAGPASLLDDIHHLRRMFGGGLPYAWPAAAVAAHYREGYLDRFRVGMQRFEAVLRAIEGNGRMRLERIPNGTNNVQLRWEGDPPPTIVRERLAAQGVLLPEPAHLFRGFVLSANETLAHMEPTRLAGLLLEAVG